MIEILFRGKTPSEDEHFDDGKWVEGFYVFDECALIVENLSYSLIDSKKCQLVGAHPVILETVGRYTGVMDKNGTKIFEGDIVEFYFFDKGHKNTKTMCIVWQDSGFCMKELFRDYRLSSDFKIIEEKIFTYRGDTKSGVYQTNYTYFVEVIGNIYDNPELMKE